MTRLIWRVRWGKDWLYVYLLIEFQSSVDWFMAMRVMTYVGLLYQDLIRSEAIGAGKRLPPVLPIVLYNGDTRWRAPVDISELIIPIPGGLERYRPQLHYLLVDEGSYHDHELATLRNLTAALFRLENSRTPEDVQHVLQALIAWLQSPQQSGLRRTFTTWLKEVFLPSRMPKVKFDEIQDLQEVHSMLAERVKEWTQNWKQQGIEEGIEQGMQGLLLRQLEWRFGPVNEAIRERVRTADTQILQVWGKRILTAQTIEEVFGD